MYNMTMKYAVTALSSNRENSGFILKFCYLAQTLNARAKLCDNWRREDLRFVSKLVGRRFSAIIQLLMGRFWQSMHQNFQNSSGRPSMLTGIIYFHHFSIYGKNSIFRVRGYQISKWNNFKTIWWILMKFTDYSYIIVVNIYCKFEHCTLSLKKNRIFLQCITQ